MAKIEGLPVNFVLSDNAFSAIADLRRAWDARYSDAADAVAIGWARQERSGKVELEGVFVTFYSREERGGIAQAIESVRGLDVVFGVPRSEYWRFERKVLDHSPERGFFLR